ncbi:murein L,D-transpeptidase catalytic domain family protein [Flavobacterium sp. LS1R47]|uniref:Murein L,D-transpeptidase catalytic domain family protein n=1 Tax=Flavobacterium frigoritolerans TaxID=2987686 RepID=A0A9X3C158_9FLAO|nr:murein L,D-transpeptidase catalytic domain family protein [Flavobacterium frigoritolerans]MCV9931946.1 murein L,D-transpeptidase catalytic domain family protein [Flavobacterium frigoritolerans]
MKKSALFLIFIGVFCVSFKCIHKEENLQLPNSKLSSKEKLASQINEIKKFVNTSSKYNTEVGFFIDMRIASCKNRFFIYDLKNNKLLDQGLVGHGSGSETGIPGKLKFSNIKNSYSTSLGKYAIGNSYNGTFGKAYKLYGLDKSNSNAFDRNIVLHKYWDVPFEEQKNPICNSQGCPMVNEKFYGVIEKIIDNSKKKIILVIYH